MSSHENNLTKKILLIHTRKNRGRLFRQNVGKGWFGKAIRTDGKGVLIPHPRRAHMGLCTGSSDIIGFTVVDGLAVFTALEVKTATGGVTTEQKNFIRMTKSNGGIAGVVRSVEDYEEIMEARFLSQEDI